MNDGHLFITIMNLAQAKDQKRHDLLPCFVGQIVRRGHDDLGIGSSTMLTQKCIGEFFSHLFPR